jgi:hypothetical protein
MEWANMLVPNRSIAVAGLLLFSAGITLASTQLPDQGAARPATNEDVAEIIKLVGAGFSDQLVIQQVKSEGKVLSFSADQLNTFTRNGIDGKVIVALGTNVTPGVMPPAALAAPVQTSLATTVSAGVPNTLMDGTPVKLRLGRTISSADERVGNEVNFEVVEEVMVNDVVVIAKDSVAMATVTEAERKKNMGRGGKLDVKIDSVRMTDGKKAALTATAGGKAGGHVGAMTGAMVATSIVFFPAAPLFLFMHGKDLTIPKGTEITAYVSGDTPLTIAKVALAESTNNVVLGAPARVSIDSNIQNCDVEVDGAFAGSTPSLLSLAAGTHEITVSQKGYTSWSKTVLVTGAGLNLRAELDSSPVTPARNPVAASSTRR